MRKVFNRFEPLSAQPVEESERYYREVATPLAQHLLASHPAVVTYTQLRVAREYDLAGNWKQRPTAWRFVIMTSHDDSSGAADTTRPSSVATGEDTRQALAQSNVYCLRELRRTPVEEVVLVDLLNGQTAVEHYVFEYDRPSSVPATDADRRLEELSNRLVDLASGAFGLRRIILNKVLHESRTEAVIEPGQRLTDGLLDETPKVGYLQVYFDDIEWGDAFFRRPEVRTLLRDPWFAVARGFHVIERCGFDKR
jgi:hypothetical protein